MNKKLLLLICCGPCGTSVIERLQENYEVTGLFYNPNIYPAEEYNKRVEAVQILGYKTGIKIHFEKYDHEEWLEYVKEYATEKEGGKRCELCFRYRMKWTAIVSSEFNYNVFTTTLSVSPHKDFNLINMIGRELADKYNTKYLNADFKKNNGFGRSCELSKKWGLYRQNYCGCEYSK